MKELICIVCPRGCHLEVDEERDYQTSGNHCDRGVEYARSELISPVRTITSTVKILGGCYPRLPVKTSSAIPKALMTEAMKIINTVCVTAPVRTGDILVKNIVNSGADLIATRSM